MGAKRLQWGPAAKRGNMSGGLMERNKLRTRRELAEAAARLFIARGYAATTVQEIAEAADPDAVYAARVTIDGSAIRPTVSWGINPGESAPIDGTVPADAAAATPASFAPLPERTSRPRTGKRRQPSACS